jgi:tRNA uridine 5-carboxymethylaminomethyl modification enzyme
MRIKQAEIQRLQNTYLSPSQANLVLQACGANLLESGARAADLLKRPELGYAEVAQMVGEAEGVTPQLAFRIETEIKYEGYIRRQLAQIEAAKKQEDTKIPEDFCYAGLEGLRLEAREKLAKIQPRSLGQASRIPGVSPNDISQLALALALAKKASK